MGERKEEIVFGNYEAAAAYRRRVEGYSEQRDGRELELDKKGSKDSFGWQISIVLELS